MNKIFVKLLCHYYFVASGLTILHFTFFNGTKFIVYYLILLPMIIPAIDLFLSMFKRGIKFPEMGWRYFFICLFLFIAFLHFVYSIENLIESLISLSRMLGSFMFLILGFKYSKILLQEDIVKNICLAGIWGAFIGVAMFLFTRSLGYQMTHSITADGAIPAVIYYAANSKIPLVAGLLGLIFVMFTGKSANLLGFLGGLLFKYFKLRRLRYVFLIIFLMLLFKVVFTYAPSLLPEKLLLRIELLMLLIENFDEIWSSTGTALSSGRSDEISYVLEKWSFHPEKFIWGDGLYTIVELGEGLSRTTIHMSYIKLIDMVGIVAFFIFVAAIIPGVIASFKYRSIVCVEFYSLCVVVQLILSIFQYTLLSDPLFWTSLGVLMSINKNKLKSSGII